VSVIVDFHLAGGLVIVVLVMVSLTVVGVIPLDLLIGSCTRSLHRPLGIADGTPPASARDRRVDS
jgi:hypothetical protein